MDLLWLSEETDLAQAVKLAEGDEVFGVVEKGGSVNPRYALRFRSQERLADFAKKHQLVDNSHLGRWKLSGIHAFIGLHGLVFFLRERSRKDVEILSLGDGSATFLASSRGEDDPAFYKFGGVPRQLLFKALNATARGMQKAANVQAKTPVSAASPSTPLRTASTRREGQAAFLRALVDAGDRDKRPAPANTGETPEPQRRRET